MRSHIMHPINMEIPKPLKCKIANPNDSIQIFNANNNQISTLQVVMDDRNNTTKYVQLFCHRNTIKLFMQSKEQELRSAQNRSISMHPLIIHVTVEQKPPRHGSKAQKALYSYSQQLNNNSQEWIKIFIKDQHLYEQEEVIEFNIRMVYVQFS